MKYSDVKYCSSLDLSVKALSMNDLPFLISSSANLQKNTQRHDKIWMIKDAPKINISNLSMDESNFMAFATCLRASPFYFTILTTRINLVSFTSFHIRPILAILTTPPIDPFPWKILKGKIAVTSIINHVLM